MTECTFCKSNQSKELYKTSVNPEETYQLLTCENCRGIYLWPKPTHERLEQAYSNVYYGEGKRKFSGIIGHLFDFMQKRRGRKFNRFLSPNSKIIDIGCGSGIFLEQMIKDGHTCTGTELEGVAAKRAASIDGLELMIGKVEDLNLPEASYDFAITWHVFEHLEDPEKCILSLRKLVKPNGIAVIALPNIASFQSIIFRGAWFHLDPPRHLFFFKRDELSQEMEKHGFSLVAERYWSFVYNPFGIQQSFLNLFIPKRDLLYELIKSNRAVKVNPVYKYLLYLYFVISTPIAFILAIIETLFKRGGSLCLVFRKDD